MLVELRGSWELDFPVKDLVPVSRLFFLAYLPPLGDLDGPRLLVEREQLQVLDLLEHDLLSVVRSQVRLHNYKHFVNLLVGSLFLLDQK